MNSAGYPKPSCLYYSPVTVEHTISKPKNDSSVNTTNMKMLKFGVMSKKLNVGTGQN
jgi:hypothetical protein